MLRSLMLVGCLGFSVLGCTGILQDHPADMVANSTPDAVLKAASQPPPPPPQPAIDVTQARRVGWVPRHATPAGDVVEGHEIEIALRPSTQEQVTPGLFVPRAPKFATPATGSQGKGSRMMAPAPPPQMPPNDSVPQPLPVHPLLQGGVNGTLTP